jgi:hypothetical protein
MTKSVNNSVTSFPILSSSPNYGQEADYQIFKVFYYIFLLRVRARSNRAKEGQKK